MATNAITQDSTGDALPQDLDTAATPQFAGLTIQDVTSTISNPPYAWLLYVKATTNLCINPRFENNVTDGVAAHGSNSAISRVTSSPIIGSANMRVVVSPAASGSGFTSTSITVTPGSTYVFSVWLRSVATQNLFVQIIRNSSGLEQTAFAVTTTAQRYALYSTMGGSDTSVTLRVVTTSAVTADFEVCGMQFESAIATSGSAFAPPSPYCDGSLGNGHAWTGTANNSTSTREAGSHILAPLTTSSAFNPLAIRPDGSLATAHQRWTVEGPGTGNLVVGDAISNFEFVGYRPTTVNLGVTDSLVKIINQSNGVALWVKSAVTTDFGMIIDCGSATSGTLFAVAAPSDLSSFSGEFFKFFDKSNRDAYKFNKERLQSGNPGLGFQKYSLFYAAGKWSETLSSNLTGIAGVLGTAMSGTGSSFTTELSVGDVVMFTGSTTKQVVEAIASNTSATVTPGSVVAQTTYQKITTQYLPMLAWTEGPNGDHRFLGKAERLYGNWFNSAGNYKTAIPAFTSGSGTLSATSGSSSFTTSSANSAIVTGTWIYAEGHVPFMVNRVISSTSFVARTVFNSTLTTVNFSYQLPDTRNTPTSDSSGEGLVTEHYKETSAAGPSASSSEVSLFSTRPKIRAGRLETNRAYRLTMAGTLSGANALKTLTLRLKLIQGSTTTTILTSAAEVFADTNTNNWVIEAVIQNANSATSQKCSFNFRAQPAVAGIAEESILLYGTASFDTAIDTEIDITAQWGVAASTMTAEMKMGEIV